MGVSLLLCPEGFVSESFRHVRRWIGDEAYGADAVVEVELCAAGGWLADEAVGGSQNWCAFC